MFLGGARRLELSPYNTVKEGRTVGSLPVAVGSSSPVHMHAGMPMHSWVVCAWYCLIWPSRAVGSSVRDCHGLM